jgi:hypothetical protein
MVSTAQISPPVGNDRPSRPEYAVWPRVLMHAAWIVALAVAVVWRVGRYGFNPSDQGFVLSLSWRLLGGAIPHVDLISPRPLGSAVLHTVDFLLPAPLFAASAFVTMVQVIVATVACAALLTGTSPLQWGPLRTGLVAAASLVNIHTFALMAWHTIDGIFLVAVGWWLLDAGLRSGTAGRRRIGLFLLGFAVMCKQSFMFAAPAGIALLLLHPAVNTRESVRSGRWWRRTIVDLLCLGAFPIAYAAVVTAAGGLSPMISQLTGGTGTWGENLYIFWSGEFVAGDIRRHILMVAGCVLLAAVAWLLRDRLGKAAVWVRALPIAGIAVVIVYWLYQTQLVYPATWATKLLWIFVAVIVLDAVVHRRLPWRPLLIVLLAYMSSLSWGYNYPGLLAGTIVLSTVELLIRALPEIRLDERRRLVPQATVAVIAVIATGFVLVRAHDRAPAADLPASALTKDLGSTTPELQWIKSSPATAKYVGQIADCLRRYPAGKVAVFADNAFAYPAFKIHSPFPMDWPIVLELVDDARQRMLDTIPKLNRDGDYLVLFQTVSSLALRTGGQVPDSVAAGAPLVTSSGLENEIRAGLTGQRTNCGSFVAVWSPHD